MSNPNETTAAETATENTANTTAAASETATAGTGNDTVAADNAAATESPAAAAPQKESEVQKVEGEVEADAEKAKAESEALLCEIRADIAELILKLQKAKTAHPLIGEVEIAFAKFLQKLV